MVLKDEFFNEVYAIDKTNNAYMIEVSLDRYTDIFSEWDPAPFKRQELDPDLLLHSRIGVVPTKFPQST